MKSSRRRTLASLSIALCFVFAACAPGSIDAEHELEGEDAELQNFLEAPELVRGPYHDPAECPHGEAMPLGLLASVASASRATTRAPELPR